jgi:hypothetical protein
MAQMFEDEKRYPDNSKRENFVFLGYPFTPPLAQDDYRSVMKELEQELPIRLWYFLDEVTTQELMRKIWRAILRADLCFFDISRGNPNVAFELGMSVAIGKPCITLLKTGEMNPLGGADLSYSERSEYTSRATLKETIRTLLVAKSSALRTLNKVSYHLDGAAFPYGRVEIENRLIKVVNTVYQKKKITKSGVKAIFGDDKQASLVIAALRQFDVLQLDGQRKAAKYLLADTWVEHDHEVVGVA